MYNITNTSLGQDAGGVWSKRVGGISGQKRQCEYKRKTISALKTLIHTNCVQKRKTNTTSDNYGSNYDIQ